MAISTGKATLHSDTGFDDARLKIIEMAPSLAF
jgi:hypothetical protein